MTYHVAQNQELRERLRECEYAVKLAYTTLLDEPCDRNEAAKVRDAALRKLAEYHERWL